MFKEIRTIETDDIEIRSESDVEQFVEGKGIIYGREVELCPGFFESIRPGAFERTLSARDEIKSFFNHDPSYVLSTTRSKPPLIIDDGKDAMRFKSPIPPTTYGNDLRVNLERKNVRGASFSFEIAPEGQIVIRDTKGHIHREIVKGTIFEIGPVTNPAYRATTAGLRSIEDVYKDMMSVVDSREAEINDVEKRKNELTIKRQLINTI